MTDLDAICARREAIPQHEPELREMVNDTGSQGDSLWYVGWKGRPGVFAWGCNQASAEFIAAAPADIAALFAEIERLTQIINSWPEEYRHAD